MSPATNFSFNRKVKASSKDMYLSIRFIYRTKDTDDADRL